MNKTKFVRLLLILVAFILIGFVLINILYIVDSDSSPRIVKKVLASEVNFAQKIGVQKTVYGEGFSTDGSSCVV